MINKRLQFDIKSSFNNKQTKGRSNIYRICITGGSCAGKTTAVAAIYQDLVSRGFRVLMVPEAATLMMKGGAMINTFNFTTTDGVIFQQTLLKLQVALEDTFIQTGQIL